MQKGSDKEAYELGLVCEFLDHLGVQDPVVESCGPPLPDVKVQCAVEGAEGTVYVEVTGYQVDRSEGRGSPTRRTAAVAQTILCRAQALCAASNASVSQAVVRVSFAPEALPPRNRADSIAQELAGFLQDESARIGPRCVTFCRRRGEFSKYPLLQEHLLTILATGMAGPASGYRLWEFDDAQGIGVIPSVLAEIVRVKGGKRRTYCVPPGSECWLLICATGETSADRAGSEIAGRGVFECEEVRATARGAGFDRICFWERVRDWHALIWPAYLGADG